MRHIVLSALVAVLLCSCSTIPQGTRSEASPHAEAIQLVMSTQQDEIRRVDTNDWWHDVKTREWKARRPFYPGTVDSTHMFIVTYRIDGQLAQAWLVDTRNKTVKVKKTSTAEE